MPTGVKPLTSISAQDGGVRSDFDDGVSRDSAYLIVNLVRASHFRSVIPEMMTTFFASPVTAEVRAAREVTTVVGPPEPPDVL